MTSLPAPITTSQTKALGTRDAESDLARVVIAKRWGSCRCIHTCKANNFVSSVRRTLKLPGEAVHELVADSSLWVPTHDSEDGSRNTEIPNKGTTQSEPQRASLVAALIF